MPRHPPNALTTLNRSHCQCSSSRCRFQRKRSAGRVTFYNPTKPMMPSTCSTDLLYWNYAEQFACSLSLRPASRDWIRYRAVRQRQSSRPSDAIPKDNKQHAQTATQFALTTQSDKLPSYLQFLHHIQPARPSMVSSELGSDISGVNPTPGSLQINLLFTIYAEQASAKADAKLVFLQKTFIANQNRQSQHHRFGGAERDRTADPLLAKQVLSQLSYSPSSSITPIPTTINRSSQN
jgi:hypothetical protein